MRELFYTNSKREMLWRLDYSISRLTKLIAQSEDLSLKEKYIRELRELLEVRSEIIYEHKKPVPFDINNVIAGLIGLIGVSSILRFERNDMITTKSLPTVLRWIGK